jgi:hypothetical protein
MPVNFSNIIDTKTYDTDKDNIGTFWGAVTALNDAQEKINRAKEASKKAKEEIDQAEAEIRTANNDIKIAQQNEIIAAQKPIIQQAQRTLDDHGLIKGRKLTTHKYTKKEGANDVPYRGTILHYLVHDINTTSANSPEELKKIKECHLKALEAICSLDIKISSKKKTPIETLIDSMQESGPNAKSATSALQILLESNKITHDAYFFTSQVFDHRGSAQQSNILIAGFSILDRDLFARYSTVAYNEFQKQIDRNPSLRNLTDLKGIQETLVVSSYYKTQYSKAKISTKDEGVGSSGFNIETYNPALNKYEVKEMVKVGSIELMIQEFLVPKLTRRLAQMTLGGENFSAPNNNVLRISDKYVVLHTPFIRDLISIDDINQERAKNKQTAFTYEDYIKDTKNISFPFSLAARLFTLDFDNNQNNVSLKGSIDFDQAFKFFLRADGSDRIKEKTEPQKILQISVESELKSLSNDDKKKRIAELNSTLMSPIHLIRAIHDIDSVDRHGKYFLHPRIQQSFYDIATAALESLQEGGELRNDIVSSIKEIRAICKWDRLSTEEKDDINKQLIRLYAVNTDNPKILAELKKKGIKCENEASLDSLADQITNCFIENAKEMINISYQMQIQHLTLELYKTNGFVNFATALTSLGGAIQQAYKSGAIKENEKIYWSPDREVMPSSNSFDYKEAVKSQILPPMTLEEYLIDKFLEDKLNQYLQTHDKYKKSNTDSDKIYNYILLSKAITVSYDKDEKKIKDFTDTERTHLQNELSSARKKVTDFLSEIEKNHPTTKDLLAEESHARLKKIKDQKLKKTKTIQNIVTKHSTKGLHKPILTGNETVSELIQTLAKKIETATTLALENPGKPKDLGLISLQNTILEEITKKAGDLYFKEDKTSEKKNRLWSSHPTITTSYCDKSDPTNNIIYKTKNGITTIIPSKNASAYIPGKAKNGEVFLINIEKGEVKVTGKLPDNIKIVGFNVDANPPKGLSQRFSKPTSHAQLVSSSKQNLIQIK